MDITGASAIVTGGASGIGEACVHRLAGLGARCVIVDLQEDKGRAVAEAVDGRYVRADVADTDQVQAAVDEAVGLGPLRVVVNSAGLSRIGRTVGRDGSPFPLEDFEFVLRVNLIGTFNTLRLAAAAMAAGDPVDDDGQRGVIVNMASAAAFDGQTGQCAYSASKGGVVAMTLPIARDLSPVGIRVNAVAPGLIDTPIYELVDDPDAFKAKLGESVLFPKRLGTADELASVVVEMVRNDYMNAEVVRLDGGIRLPPR